MHDNNVNEHYDADEAGGITVLDIGGGPVESAFDDVETLQHREDDIVHPKDGHDRPLNGPEHGMRGNLRLLPLRVISEQIGEEGRQNYGKGEEIEDYGVNVEALGGHRFRAVDTVDFSDDRNERT